MRAEQGWSGCSDSSDLMGTAGQHVAVGKDPVFPLHWGIFGVAVINFLPLASTFVHINLSHPFSRGLRASSYKEKKNFHL